MTKCRCRRRENEMTQKYKTVEPFEERQHTLGGTQRLYRFPNGYGASVIKNSFSYGGKEGLWELAVIRFADDADQKGRIAYDTRITTDAEGWLTEEDVQRLLKRIKRLKRKDP
jgi:hypothetical protein